MSKKEVNVGVKIVILPTAAKATYAGAESKRIVESVENNVLRPSKEPYHKVHVAVKHRPNGAPEYLVAFMLREYTYTVDIARIDVDAKYAAKSVAFVDYEDIDESSVAVPEVPAKAPRPGRKVEMVFGTPVPEIPTAKAAVEYAYNLALQLGYRAVKLLGKSASVANYKKYLTADLKVFGNVGHGYTGGIVLFDGNLTSVWFNRLANTPVSPAVVYFNSCQVFNPPLQPAVMGAGARTFIGGKVNLLIGPSEEVFKCFLTKTLKEKKKMAASLKDCEKAKYPLANAHGLSGDSGKF